MTLTSLSTYRALTLAEGKSSNRQNVSNNVCHVFFFFFFFFQLTSIEVCYEQYQVTSKEKEPPKLCSWPDIVHTLMNAQYIFLLLIFISIPVHWMTKKQSGLRAKIEPRKELHTVFILTAEQSRVCLGLANVKSYFVFWRHLMIMLRRTSRRLNNVTSNSNM